MKDLAKYSVEELDDELLHAYSIDDDEWEQMKLSDPNISEQ